MPKAIFEPSIRCSLAALQRTHVSRLADRAKIPYQARGVNLGKPIDQRHRYTSLSRYRDYRECFGVERSCFEKVSGGHTKGS